MSIPDIIPRKHESADSVLAKNLVVARAVAGVTQQELAARSFVSRATIAQIETGSSDPRLSTITDLASALGISPMLLLLGKEEIQILAGLHNSSGVQPIPIELRDLERLRSLVATGMLRDRLDAAKLAASIVRAAGRTDPVLIIGAAIFSAAYPGSGTHAGIAFGELSSNSTGADGGEKTP